ncbi:MAG: metallophosphoesterase family protein [Sulfitobacter sp.]
MADIRHRDLGALDGPILAFGGPYSNAQALAALIRAAQERGIAAGRMICTGDVVAYCGAPARTVAQMRALGCAVVAGNCEIQLGRGKPDCGCGFEDGSACDLLSVGWYGFASGVLGQVAKAWMAGLPDVLSFVHHGARYAVVHGGMTDVARFIWHSSDLSVFAQEWAAVEQVVGPVDHIIAGHAGVPFVKSTPQGRWINAGVIGMPPHDGQQDTRFAVLDQGEVRIEVLCYDVQGAVDDMAQAGLPQGYRDGLISGYWPSEDVLPAGLRVPSLASG